MVKSLRYRSPLKTITSTYKFMMNIWENYRWELFLCVSILTIVICWFLKKHDNKFDGILVDTSIIQKTPTPLGKKGVYKNEERCREVIQSIYNAPFKKIRPNFLKNPKTGRNLELDMYNDNLKIALEYNGIQHRTYAPYFHKSQNDYYDQVDRDKLKDRLCKENGVLLIVVPDTVRYNEIELFIKTELKKSGRL